jgi:hypothetical protein
MQVHCHIVKDCKYDKATGRVYFTTDHFSMYTVGYNDIDFNDVLPASWYHGAVDFVTVRQLFLGMGSNKKGLENLSFTCTQGM